MPKTDGVAMAMFSSPLYGKDPLFTKMANGEFLSAVAAGPVYALLGKEGLGTGQMPTIHQPIQHTIGYHIRAGKHDVRAWTSADGKSFYRFGDGFRADGQRPFLDRCAFDGGKPTRVFESDGKRLEAPVTLLSADGKRFLTLAQSATEPPNWFLRRAGEASAMAVRSEPPRPSVVMWPSSSMPWKPATMITLPALRSASSGLELIVLIFALV